MRWKHKQKMTTTRLPTVRSDCSPSKFPDTPFARAFQIRRLSMTPTPSRAQRISPQQPQSVTSITTTELVTRAAVDYDDDRPRSPRIHTISRETFEDYDDAG